VFWFKSLFIFSICALILSSLICKRFAFLIDLGFEIEFTHFFLLKLLNHLHPLLLAKLTLFYQTVVLSFFHNWASRVEAGVCLLLQMDALAVFDDELFDCEDRLVMAIHA